MFYHIRVHKELYDFVETLCSDSSRYIVCQEVGSITEKEHRHVCVELAIGEAALRKRLQAKLKELGLTGLRGHENAYYGGIQVCTDESYVCKEGMFIASSGYTPERLAELCSDGASKYKKPIEDNGPMAPGPRPLKPAEKRKMDMDKFCDELVSSLQCKVINDKLSVNDTFKEICKALCRFRFARINDNIAFPIIQSCLWRLHPHTVEDQFEERIAKKFGNLFSHY